MLSQVLKSVSLHTLMKLIVDQVFYQLISFSGCLQLIQNQMLTTPLLPLSHILHATLSDFFGQASFCSLLISSSRIALIALESVRRVSSISLSILRLGHQNKHVLLLFVRTLVDHSEPQLFQPSWFASVHSLHGYLTALYTEESAKGQLEVDR